MALNFKFIFFVLSFFVFLFFGCSDSDKRIQLLDENYQQTIKSKNNNEAQKQNNDTKVEISKIEAGNKLEIAKLQANNLFEIQKVKSLTTKEIALADAKIKSEDSRVIIYISSVIGFLLFVLIIIIYLSSKKKAELKLKLQAAELKQQKEIADREMEEKRLEMMINLASEEKLPKEMQEQLVSLMGKKSNLVIESKNS